MEAWTNSNPSPVVSREYGDCPHKRPDKTGTKGNCKVCGRPTYRNIGPVYVCSYCTADYVAKHGRYWNGSSKV